MAWKWLNSATVRAAVVSGVFVLIATIIASVFTLKRNGKVESPEKQCEIEIIEFRLHHFINRKPFTAKENDIIAATHGDTLKLKNFEMNLSIKFDCLKSEIAAEAHLRKPETINIDPDDKYDYNDGRFTNGAAVKSAFISSEFFAKNGTDEWILRTGWNNLVVALVEYSPQKPDGKVLRRYFFRISN